MVKTHVSFSVNSHSFWHHQRIHWSLSYPLEKKCSVFVRTTRLLFIPLCYFIFPVTCLKTPSKCAAEGWDFIDNRLISLHKWERESKTKLHCWFFARWIISVIWFSDPESILKLEKDVAVLSKNRRQILLILLRGETMVMGGKEWRLGGQYCLFISSA